jgi:hypothetical protein
MKILVRIALSFGWLISATVSSF